MSNICFSEYIKSGNVHDYVQAETYIAPDAQFCSKYNCTCFVLKSWILCPQVFMNTMWTLLPTTFQVQVHQQFSGK